MQTDTTEIMVRPNNMTLTYGDIIEKLKTLTDQFPIDEKTWSDPMFEMILDGIYAMVISAVGNHGPTNVAIYARLLKRAVDEVVAGWTKKEVGGAA